MGYRVGVIGCGNQARDYYLPSLRRIRGIELVGVCDIIKSKADDMAEKYKSKPFYQAEELLDKTKPDLVMILTREEKRDEPALACLKAKVNVFCEKPLYASRGQYNVQPDDVPVAEKMVATAAKVKRHIAMGYNYRFMPPYQRIRKIIDRGELGDPVFVNIRTNVNAWCHMTDLMRWFMGEVVSLGAFISGPAEQYDRAATLKFANGAVGTLVGSMRLAMFHPVNRLEIGGTKERLTVNDLAGPLHRYSNVRPERSMIGPPDKMGWQGYYDSFHEHTKAMLKKMMAGEPPPSTGIDGLRELQIQAAIVTSSKENRFVKPY